MKLNEILFLLVVVSCTIANGTGERWERNCKYYFDNGSLVDLSPLDNPENPLYGYLYY